MAGLKTRRQTLREALPQAGYAISVIFFLWLVSGFYLPGKGFSALVLLGDKMADRALPEFMETRPYVQADSYGYDGQFYVQIAVEPNLRDPDLDVAVDNLPYRARRILLSWTAWVAGGGDPARVVQVFSLQNVICWLGLAGLLLRWFPSTSWENYFRWAGVMFCYGLCFSVRGSLLDGPSLLFMAVGVVLLEKGRPWSSAAVLAVSGLVRETNILTASVLASPGQKTWREWAGMLARGVLVAVPCALWVLYLNHVYGTHDAGGTGNFSVPFVAYGQKVAETFAEIRAVGWNEANFSSVTMLVALTAQAAFLALRPRLSEPWWRIGAPYIVLMVILGEAMWDGYPGAAARALLPLTLVFNVLVPRGRRWWALLLLGNATVFSAFVVFRVPADQSYKLTTTPALAVTTTDADQRGWDVVFDENWYRPERSRGEYWSWSRGPAAVTIHNPLSFAVSVDFAGGLKALESQAMVIRSGERVLWSGTVGSSRVDFSVNSVRIDPGLTVFRFETDREARAPSAADGRLLAFSLRDLDIRVRSKWRENTEEGAAP